MFLRPFLIPKEHYKPNGTMTLRTLFKSEGTKKEGEEKNSSSTQAKWGRREKSFLTTQENFWCEKK
jgi:hypothetical protein